MRSTALAVRKTRTIAEAARLTRVIHPHTSVAHVSAEVGRGVIADQTIRRGTIVWTQDRFDRVLAAAEVAALDAPHRAIVDRYAHQDAHGNSVLCWDAGRLVNHHCDPAIRGVGPTMMVARRDLAAGEPITCDYAECNLDPALACRCGSPACRRSIHGRDLLRLGADWDAEVQGLLAAAASVEQPLWPYLLDPGGTEDMLHGRTPVPTFLSQCAFGPRAADP